MMQRRSEAKRDMIYHYLVSQCDQNGTYKASVESIIKGLGFGSIPTITKYLSDLQEAGKVRIKSGRPTTYEVVNLATINEQMAEEEKALYELIEGLSSSIPKIAERLKALQAEMMELRQFKASLSEIHRTKFEVLYRRELPAANIELQPVPIQSEYGA